MIMRVDEGERGWEWVRPYDSKSGEDSEGGRLPDEQHGHLPVRVQPRLTQGLSEGVVACTTRVIYS